MHLDKNYRFLVAREKLPDGSPGRARAFVTTESLGALARVGCVDPYSIEVVQKDGVLILQAYHENPGPVLRYFHGEILSGPYESFNDAWLEARNIFEVEGVMSE
jgi:hypothetical protein